MKIYNLLEIVNEKEAILDGKKIHIITGKHSIYAPKEKLKFTWSYQGKITPFRNHKLDIPLIMKNRWNKGEWCEKSLKSIVNEAKVLQFLSEQKMAPPTGDIFFIKNVISNFPYGEKYCDNMGIYGYHMENANTLPKGKFDIKKIRGFIDKRILRGTDLAVADLMSVERDNLVNGYTIDIRRSFREDLEHCNNIIHEDVKSRDINGIRYKQNKEKLKEKVLMYGQYPFKKRKQNYQDYYLGDEYIEGSRKIQYRFDEMGIPKQLEGTAVDLGTCTGSVIMEAYRRGARKCTGMDFQSEYIDIARDVSRYNGYYINFIEGNLMKPDKVIEYLNTLYKGEVIDTLFALALYKHTRENIIKIIKGLNYCVCFFEGHASLGKGFDSKMNVEIEKSFKSYGIKYERIGFSNDRNQRSLWRLK